MNNAASCVNGYDDRKLESPSVTLPRAPYAPPVIDVMPVAEETEFGAGPGPDGSSLS